VRLRLAIIGTVLVWLPFLLLALSLILSDALGCRVDAAATYPCPVLGADIGGLLGAGFMMGLLLMGTWPLMVFSLIGWGLWGARRLWARR